MNQDLAQFFQEHLYTIIFFQVIVSLAFAFIVFLVGTRRGKRNLGLIGSIVTFFLGVLSPVLGLISAAVFFTLIIVKTGKSRDGEISGTDTF